MRRRNLLFISLLSALVALPAASQQNKTPPTNLYIDALTHNMAGMPDMGGMMGGLAGMMMRRRGGEDTSRPTYPTTRAGGMTGQYLDIALHNALKPGVQADDQIPAGLNLGRSLTLTPITESQGSHESSRGGPTSGTVPDMELRISEYWGCGAEVRPGQPKVTTIKVRGGSFDPSKGPMGMQGMGVQMQGSVSRSLNAQDRDIDLQPGYVYWPNRQFGRQVPRGASLVGEHQISGDGIPASMRFQVSEEADFMPQLALRAQGQPADAVYLGWPTVARARAYFINGMHMQQLGQNSWALTIWSSADVPGAGAGLHASLSGGEIDKWLKQKVLLPPSATSCVIPRGIFAGQGGGQGSRESGAMPAFLTMSAYGPETWITYPPRPADRKQPWNPEWSVRLRTRSTATSLLGMDFGNMQGDPQQQQQPQRRRGGLLNSILGG